MSETEVDAADPAARRAAGPRRDRSDAMRKPGLRPSRRKGRAERREADLIVRWVGAGRRRRKDPPGTSATAVAPIAAEVAIANVTISNVIILADARPYVPAGRPRRVRPAAGSTLATLLPFVRRGPALPGCCA